MKKIALILFVGIMSFSMNAQEKVTVVEKAKETVKKVDPNAPVFEFERKIVDYGAIEKGSKGTYDFKFKNIGKSPLIITAVKGSCGCTVPTKPEEPIMPGDSGEIKVKYATNRIGPFSKTVTITSNAYEPTVVLKVKGRVLENEAADLQKKKSVVSEN